MICTICGGIEKETGTSQWKIRREKLLEKTKQKKRRTEQGSALICATKVDAKNKFMSPRYWTIGNKNLTNHPNSPKKIKSMHSQAYEFKNLCTYKNE